MKHLKIPSKKITVIYNGTEKNRLKPLGDNSSLKEKYILYVGDLRKRKNVFNLVLAYLELGEKLLGEYKLYLTGEGKLVDKIKKVAKKKGRLDRIVFLKRVTDEELGLLYLGAELFVFPSLEEGFGLPVIEAQTNRLPVICGEHSSLAEVAARSVLYADVRSVADLKNKMAALLTDSLFREKIAQKGYENSFRFTPRKMVFEYKKLFNQIVVGN